MGLLVRRNGFADLDFDQVPQDVKAFVAAACIFIEAQTTT
jgi:hypothetical protein